MKKLNRVWANVDQRNVAHLKEFAARAPKNPRLNVITVRPNFASIVQSGMDSMKASVFAT